MNEPPRRKKMVSYVPPPVREIKCHPRHEKLARHRYPKARIVVDWTLPEQSRWWVCRNSLWSSSFEPAEPGPIDDRDPLP